LVGEKMKIYNGGAREVQWTDAKSGQPVIWYKVFKIKKKKKILFNIASSI
jgi:hypothetical protein